MFSIRRATAGLLMGLAAIVTVPTQPMAQEQAIDAVRHALERMPYYGVFDLLAYSNDRGTVTLSGFAYAPGLERDAVKTVKGLPGVETVVSKIEPLSLSTSDERIRWATFYAIYNDAFLARYAPGGGLSRFDRLFFSPRFPGMQPFGTYPIHIIVNRGRTVLVGSVDSEADRNVAGIRAREVTGTFGVENEIVVTPRGTR